MQDARLTSWLWGPVSALGIWAALLTLAADQAHKWWILAVYRLQDRGRVHVTPFLDLVYLKNRGISYGLLPLYSREGQWLFAGFAGLAVVVMAVWLARGITGKLPALSLGLIMGGAAGNAIDRLVLGGVADYMQLHAFGFYWYVFNIADAALVAGCCGLLYEFLRSESQSRRKVALSPSTKRGLGG